MPGDVGRELAAVGNPKVVAKLRRRLAAAAQAFENERFRDADNILKELVALTPESAAIHELYGLTLYRLGRWRSAIKQLEMFHELSGSVDQHPVLADCERALGRHAQVEQLWKELRQGGAGVDTVAEGRLVMAGSLADRGLLDDAIAFLAAPAGKPVRHPAERHVRQWYALADLYERAGDLPRARELFRRVVEADAELSDATERLAALA
jgi:tetratricopeptide (TPR) repeat protein